MKIFAAVFLLCFSLALCTGCANTKKPSMLEQFISERKANTGDHAIKVQSLPPGAIIDLNNDVVGTSPCFITIKDAYKAQWPGNGLTIQTINARWTDGSHSNQTFWTGSQIPKHIVFLHPNPSKILSEPPTLTQR